MDLTASRLAGVDAYVARPGGGPYHLGGGRGRLETPVAFLGRVSRDPFGERLRARLRASHVSDRYLREGAEPTTLALVHSEPDREPEFAFYTNGTADRLLVPADLPDRLPAEVAGIHFGSLSLVLEPGASTLEGLMAREHGRRLVSLDPNVRPAVIPDRAAYLGRLERWLPSVDLVKVSRADLAWLHPGEPLDDAARRWLDRGPALVVVTRGAGGRGVAGPGGAGGGGGGPAGSPGPPRGGVGGGAAGVPPGPALRGPPAAPAAGPPTPSADRGPR